MTEGRVLKARAFWHHQASPEGCHPQTWRTQGSTQQLAKPRHGDKMREDWVREGQPGGKARVGQVATAEKCVFRCSMSVPIPQNSLLHSVEETLSTLVSGLGKALEQESWALIPARLLCATQALPPALCSSASSSVSREGWSR